MKVFQKLADFCKNCRLWMLIAGSLLAVLPATAKPVSVGPFEIVTSHHRYFSGYETGTNDYTEYDTYGIRYHGKPYGFDAPNGIFEKEKVHYTSFTQALILPCSEPAILVMVGDPNNTFFYYLIREHEGTPQAELVSRGRDSDALIWLDAINGQPDPDRKRQECGTLSAGTWLMLGHDCVMNVRTLERRPVSDVPGVYFQASRVLELSPDGKTVVRFAKRAQTDEAFALVATNFMNDRSTILPVDRTRMRFNHWEKLDHTWVDHHFAWTKDKDGFDVLQERPNFAVLPHAGEIVDQGGGEIRYRIENAKPDIISVMAEVLVQDLHAKLVEPDPEAWRKLPLPCGTYLVKGQQVRLYKYDEASINASQKGQEDLIRRIGKQIDQKLASGAYDASFAL